jgi:deoxyribonuclease V
VTAASPSPREAVELQRVLAARVQKRGALRHLRTVAGVDVALRGGRARAAAVLFAAQSGEPLESSVAELPLDFPYVPGLLGFREVPAMRAALARLSTVPDLLLVDGHGYAHPRRFGVACHLGVELDLPAIGCGKSRLVGEHAEPALRRGSRRPLLHAGECIGSVLRTRTGVRPVYVSIGHRVDLATAVRLVLRFAARFRLPEPIRAADRLAGSGP